jgi:hypothetical protein
VWAEYIVLCHRGSGGAWGGAPAVSPGSTEGGAYKNTANNTSNDFLESVLIRISIKHYWIHGISYLNKGGMPSCPDSLKPLVQIIRVHKLFYLLYTYLHMAM